MHDVSIIIPWRDSGQPHRQANLVRVLDHLAELDLPLILAPDGRDSGPFNRSAAYNEGMRLSPSEVYVFHEADMLLPLDQIRDGVDAAATGLGMVVPFTTYRYLTEDDSRQVISGAVSPAACQPEWIMDHGRSIGAVNIASAESMAWVGQWDTRLEGHGYDDVAMMHAFDTACGGVRLIEGPGHHLYHHMAYAPWERGTLASNPENFPPEEVAATARNRARVKMYQRATTPEQVRHLTAGGDL